MGWWGWWGAKYFGSYSSKPKKEKLWRFFEEAGGAGVGEKGSGGGWGARVWASPKAVRDRREVLGLAVLNQKERNSWRGVGVWERQGGWGQDGQAAGVRGGGGGSASRREGLERKKPFAGARPACRGRRILESGNSCDAE